MLPREPPGPRSSQNAAVLLAGGRRVAAQAKTLLPTYDVFDEKRYFVPAARRAPVRSAARRVGLTVCEDTWVDPMGYARGPGRRARAAGAALVLNLSARPGTSARRRSGAR